MQPFKNPNAWSCLPTAFAIALNVDIQHILDYVEHDGSEIIYSDLAEPLCRRGFHPQEMIRYCLQVHNIAVTRIELAPTALPCPNMDPHVFDTGGWTWFKYNMFHYYGVIDCRTASGTGHAMAFAGLESKSDIYDPATGDKFTFSDSTDAEQRGRFLVALWRLNKIK